MRSDEMPCEVWHNIGYFVFFLFFFFYQFRISYIAYTAEKNIIS